ERAREAAHDRLVAEARAGYPTRTSLPRRALANGLALVSRGSAAAVRRLDECVADDLGRSLAPTELAHGVTATDRIPGTAAVSWGPERIDLFTVDEARRL